MKSELSSQAPLRIKFDENGLVLQVLGVSFDAAPDAVSKGLIVSEVILERSLEVGPRQVDPRLRPFLLVQTKAEGSLEIIAVLFTTFYVEKVFFPLCDQRETAVGNKFW